MPCFANVQLLIFSMRAAGDMKFRVERVSRLTVKMGKHEACAASATRVIFRTTFIDKEVSRINTKNRQIVLTFGYAVAIVKRVLKNGTPHN